MIEAGKVALELPADDFERIVFPVVAAPAGQWIAVTSVDPHAAALLFRHKVLVLLRDKELIDQRRIALLLSWKHRGFSVHNSVSVEAGDSRAIERLVR